jgi:hypothetical protein
VNAAAHVVPKRPPRTRAAHDAPGPIGLRGAWALVVDAPVGAVTLGALLGLGRASMAAGLFALATGQPGQGAWTLLGAGFVLAAWVRAALGTWARGRPPFPAAPPVRTWVAVALGDAIGGAAVVAAAAVGALPGAVLSFAAIQAGAWPAAAPGLALALGGAWAASLPARAVLTFAPAEIAGGIAGGRGTLPALRACLRRPIPHYARLARTLAASDLLTAVGLLTVVGALPFLVLPVLATAEEPP